MKKPEANLCDHRYHRDVAPEALVTYVTVLNDVARYRPENHWEAATATRPSSAMALGFAAAVHSWNFGRIETCTDRAS